MFPGLYEVEHYRQKRSIILQYGFALYYEENEKGRKQRKKDNSARVDCGGTGHGPWLIEWAGRVRSGFGGGGGG